MGRSTRFGAGRETEIRRGFGSRRDAFALAGSSRLLRRAFVCKGSRYSAEPEGLLGQSISERPGTVGLEPVRAGTSIASGGPGKPALTKTSRAVRWTLAAYPLVSGGRWASQGLGNVTRPVLVSAEFGHTKCMCDEGKGRPNRQDVRRRGLNLGSWGLSPCLGVVRRGLSSGGHR